MGKSLARLTLEALATREDGAWGPMTPLIKRHRLVGRSVFVELIRLEASGFVRSRAAERWTRQGRKEEYQITSEGRAALLRDDL